MPKAVRSCFGGVSCAQGYGYGRPFSPHMVRFYDLSTFVLGAPSAAQLSKVQGGSWCATCSVLLSDIVFSHVTRCHRRVAPINHPRGQMASEFHDFLGKHTDGQAHSHQVSKIAAPNKLARQAFLCASTPNPRTPDTSTLPNLTSNDGRLNPSSTQECLRALLHALYQQHCHSLNPIQPRARTAMLKIGYPD
jgi:hypothetical protein